MVSRWQTALVFIVIAVLCLIFGGCWPFCPQIPKEKPRVVWTDSKGEKVTEFAVLDAVHGSFSRLLPNRWYEIRVVRSDGREISYSSYSSDSRGVIPTTVLWYEPGVEYSESRVGILDLKRLYAYDYTCVISRGKVTVARVPIRFRSLNETGPIIYSSDRNGNPLNGYKQGKESVYISGLNFPSGKRIYIDLVRDRYAWDIGDRLEPLMERPRVIELDDGQGTFTTLLWPDSLNRIGSYDIILRFERADRFIDDREYIDSHYNVGFTVFGAPSLHIEEDLACQAPPYDHVTGNVIGAPSPIYKDMFAPVEEVWVAVNPRAGGGDYAGQSARLYVVNHMVESAWVDGVSLADVSGGFETAVIQPGCANVNYTRVWINPSIGDYDVIVDFAPFGTYTGGTDIIDKLDASGFYVPSQWICLESVSFNHNTGSNLTDAINIRLNQTEDVVVPEWQKATKTYPAAYIKSKNITVRAVFSAGSGVDNCKIRAAVSYGSLGEVLQQTVTFPGGSSGSVSFNISGATPGQIKSFTQKWLWYVEDINGGGSPEALIGASKNRIYIMLAEPQSPWTTSGQTEPWIEVLQKSCWWAFGQTTPEGAAEKIQHYLYNNLGGYYQYGSQYTSSTTGPFNMTSFLQNIPSIGDVNCYDMGKSLVAFSNVVGCNLVYKYSSPFGSLNCEKAIGRPWNCSEGFGNHGFGNIVDNVFDACLTVDTDADPTSGPPYTETWMTNIPWNSYNSTVVKNATASTPVHYVFSVN